MKKVLVGVLGSIAFFVAVLLALPYITNLTTVRNRIAATATEALQHPVTIAHLGLKAIPSPGLQIEGLRITERDGSPIIDVNTLVVEVKLGPLLQQRVDVTRIIVGQPRISLIRNADASLNLPLPESAPPATPQSATGIGGEPSLDLVLGKLRVKDGELTVRERQQPNEPPLLHLQKVNVEVDDLSIRGKTKDDFNHSLTATVRMEVKDGTIGNLHTLSQILSLLQFKQLFSGKIPDLSRQSIEIDSLTGTLGFKNGLMNTNDLKLQSPVLNATVKGTFNVPDKQMKMVVTVMGLDFDVHGSADRPSVSARGVKGLKEGVGGLVEKGLGLFR
jgi:uncharacterized protein YhdP